MNQTRAKRDGAIRRACKAAAIAAPVLVLSASPASAATHTFRSTADASVDSARMQRVNEADVELPEFLMDEIMKELGTPVTD